MISIPFKTLGRKLNSSKGIPFQDYLRKLGRSMDMNLIALVFNWPHVLTCWKTSIFEAFCVDTVLF